MVHGYIRVSTDKQSVDNQRFEIERFSLEVKFPIEQCIEETISGRQTPEKRLLGSLLAEAKRGDIIICTEISRLGRSLFMIISILNYLLEKGVKIWTIKDNYRLEDDLQSKMLAVGFALSAEVERTLISQRTKEALARKKAEGVILGRPKGSKSARYKLTGHEAEIRKLLDEKVSRNAIAKIYGVDRKTVVSFIEKNPCPVLFK
jgi:DNA invertase Pin-like site-specific DNA recombinase